MSPTKKRSASAGGLGTLIVLAVLVGLGAIYTFFGNDSGGGKTAEPTALVISTSTSLPVAEAPASTETPLEIPTEISASETPAVATAIKIPEATAANKPGWWQVYFVTPNRIGTKDEVAYATKGMPANLFSGSTEEKLIQYIDAAQTSIHIASYETDLLEVTQALIRAKQRGVDVRWITDDEAGIAKDKDPGRGKFKMLKEAGIEVIDDKRGGLMHNKFWLFDGKITWTGSTNVTVSGMFEQNNNVIVIDSPELTAIYERQWAELWSGKFNAKAPSTVDQQKLTIDGTKLQILFSPEDKVMDKLIPLVQGAQKSIYFMAFTYTQEQMGAAMLQRAQNGVKVTGVFEATGSDSEYGQMTPLFCGKVPVRTDGNPAFLHHKVIVIDEHLVITGSLNFTDNASQSNNENVIIIDNPEIAKLYIEEFQRVWAAGKDPAKIKCK